MKISTFGFLTRRGVRNLGKHLPIFAPGWISMPVLCGPAG